MSDRAWIKTVLDWIENDDTVHERFFALPYDSPVRQAIIGLGERQRDESLSSFVKRTVEKLPVGPITFNWPDAFGVMIEESGTLLEDGTIKVNHSRVRDDLNHVGNPSGPRFHHEFQGQFPDENKVTLAQRAWNRQERENVFKRDALAQLEPAEGCGHDFVKASNERYRYDWQCTKCGGWKSNG